MLKGFIFLIFQRWIDHVILVRYLPFYSQGLVTEAWSHTRINIDDQDKQNKTVHWTSCTLGSCHPSHQGSTLWRILFVNFLMKWSSCWILDLDTSSPSPKTSLEIVSNEWHILTIFSPFLGGKKNTKKKITNWGGNLYPLDGYLPLSFQLGG